MWCGIWPLFWGEGLAGEASSRIPRKPWRRKKSPSESSRYLADWVASLCHRAKARLGGKSEGQNGSVSRQCAGSGALPGMGSGHFADELEVLVVGVGTVSWSRSFHPTIAPSRLARATGRTRVGPGKESSGCRCPLRPERPVPGGPPPSPRLKTGEGEVHRRHDRVRAAVVEGASGAGQGTRLRIRPEMKPRHWAIIPVVRKTCSSSSSPTGHLNVRRGKAPAIISSAGAKLARRASRISGRRGSSRTPFHCRPAELPIFGRERRRQPSRCMGGVLVE